MTGLPLLAALAVMAADDLQIQGLLRSAGGGVDGSYALTIGVYDQATGGNLLLTQSLPDVAVSNGVFDLALTGLTPAILEANPSVWVGVKVEGEVELPRQRVHPVARALIASRALSLSCSGCVTSTMLAGGAAPTYAAGVGLLLDAGTFALNLTFLDARYVNTTGDTMTGTLSILADLDVTGDASVGGTLTAGRIQLPKATNAALPVPSAANAGLVYFATDTGRLVYSDGTRWVAVGEQPPVVLSVTPGQVAPSQVVTLTLLGSGFEAGAKVSFDDVKATSVTVVSGTELAVATPIGLTSGTYDVVVTNLSGLQGTLPQGLVVNGPPGWVSASGSLGQIQDVGASQIAVQALDPEFGAITYAVVLGNLPPGLALNSLTGQITGDPNNVAAATTATFTVRATDTAPTPNSVDRSFALTILPSLDGTSSTRASTSCAALLNGGFSTGSAAYWITSGGATFQVWCDMVTEGGGFIDVVRTMNLPGIDLAAYRDRFFITNNGYALQLGVGAETTTSAPGFYVINLIPGYAHTEGCHFKPPMLYSQVRVTYRMQGNDEGTRCSNGNYIPLHGPGYDGGQNAYLSSCPAGFSCIQGRPEEGRDAPISATYSSDGITSANTLLTWSGSGAGTSQAGNCARDNAIPVANPCTFFTRLLIK